MLLERAVPQEFCITLAAIVRHIPCVAVHVLSDSSLGFEQLAANLTRYRRQAQVHVFHVFRQSRLRGEEPLTIFALKL